MSAVKEDVYEEPIMLLGPIGKNNIHLCYRKKIKEELLLLGFKKIIIMELEDNNFISLEEKFDRIIVKYDPILIIALFITGEKMDGVNFEIGWLCCKYKISNLSKKLRILCDPDYNWNNTSAYIYDLFDNVPHDNYDESHHYSKTSAKIHKSILSIKF